MFKLKRVYEPPSPDDGERVLVDRLWPRGMTKEKAAVDLWMKEISPSTELRKWFDHDPAKWAEFQARYREELKARPELVDELRRKAREGTVTLLYGARNQEQNEAVVLMEFLGNQSSPPAEILTEVRRLGLRTPGEAAALIRADRDPKTGH